MDGSFHLVCAQGDYNRALSMLQIDESLVESIDNNDRLPLHWACASASLELVELLLSLADKRNRSDCRNAGDDAGWTPVMIAVAANRNEKIPEMLIQDKDVDLTLKSRVGSTCMHLAASKNRVKLARMIIGRAPELAKTKGDYEKTPLHCAAAVGATDIMKILLDAGAPINASDSQNWTALHHACAEAQIHAAAFLINSGADVTRTDKDRKTPVELLPDKAAENKFYTLCDTLNIEIRK